MPEGFQQELVIGVLLLDVTNRFNVDFMLKAA